MPNIVVYVGVDDAKKFGDSRELAQFVRDVVKAALSERGGAGPDPGAVTEKDDRRDTDGGRAALAPRSLDAPRSESDRVMQEWADHFKPDPKAGKKT